MSIFSSETSSLHWKSILENTWGQQKRVSTLWRWVRYLGGHAVSQQHGVPGINGHAVGGHGLVDL